MKLQTIEVSTVRTAATGQNEKATVRLARMTAMWKMAVNAVLYPVGQLLATSVGNGKTLADFVAKGESIELESINIEGKVLPLAPGYTISLKSIGTWGCPACRSAHGSHVYPSREVTVDGLQKNKWFYNPQTKALFVISATCWKDYVVELGAATDDRFMSPHTHADRAEAAAAAAAAMASAPKALAAGAPAGHKQGSK